MEILDDLDIPQNPIDHAGFGLRFVAWIIDAILLAFITGILHLIFGGAMFDRSSGLSWYGDIITLVYFIAMEGGPRNATFGKQLVGIRVTDMQGAPIGYDKAAIRTLSKILSAILLLIGFIMIIFSEKKQGLHDMIANTLVIRNK